MHITNISDYMRYIALSFSHSLEFGAILMLRTSLVFILLSVFLLNDTQAFGIYTVAAILKDMSSMIGSYFASNILQPRLTWLLGFSMFVGGEIFCILTFGKSVNFLYISLGMISCAYGVMKCNSLVLANNYITNAVDSKYRANHTGVMYLIMVFIILISLLATSAMLAYLDKISIFYGNLIIIGLAFCCFMSSEWRNILDEFKIQSVKWLKLLYLLPIIFLFYFFCLSQTQTNFVTHTPIVIFIVFFIYLLFRAKKRIHEKAHIYYALFSSVPFIFYLSLEKQVDTVFALFIDRNIDKKIFGFEVPTLAVNSLFSFFILIIGGFFFKFQIFSRLNERKSIITILCFATLAFFTLFLTCVLSENGVASLKYYSLALIFLSVCDILVYSKLMSVCRIMPKNLQYIISSFMIINISAGFYVSRFYASSAAVDTNVGDKLNSIAIYQHNFGNLTALCAVVFIFSCFALRVKFIEKLLEIGNVR